MKKVIKMPPQTTQKNKDLSGLIKTLSGSDTGGQGVQSTHGDKTHFFKRPPVHKWHPEDCGEIGLKIHRDGRWSYQGSPIDRQALVRLFASVLRGDADGQTYLVTPVEKIKIEVEDAAFAGAALEVEHQGGGQDRQKGQKIYLRTQFDEEVLIGRSHGLVCKEENKTGGLKPYVHIYGRLYALLPPQLALELMNYGEVLEVRGQSWYGIFSDGVFFKMAPFEDVENAEIKT